MTEPASGGIRIGTRSSELALRQARQVQALLSERGLESTIVGFKTAGDKKLDAPITAAATIGLFTHEIESALRRRKIDVAVHALSDVSTTEIPHMLIGGVLARDDPRDALVVNGHVPAATLAELPPGSRVATSSLCRRAQVLSHRRDLELAELRGHLPERLRKVDEGRVHAGVFSAAALHRLDARQHITCYLEPPGWLPVAGQGTIALQVREDDARMRELASELNHASTWRDVSAERAFLASLEGGIQVPIGALVTRDDAGVATLHGVIADALGTHVVRGSIVVDDDPELGGIRLANHLRGEGASEILEGLRRANHVPRPQPS